MLVLYQKVALSFTERKSETSSSGDFTTNGECAYAYRRRIAVHNERGTLISDKSMVSHGSGFLAAIIQQCIFSKLTYGLVKDVNLPRDTNLWHLSEVLKTNQEHMVKAVTPEGFNRHALRAKVTSNTIHIMTGKHPVPIPLDLLATPKQIARIVGWRLTYGTTLHNL